MKAERKYLATYLDAAFDMTYGKPDYVRLGKDLEEYSEELNPNVDSKNNIIGEKQVNHTGYDISSEASPFYYEYDDALSEKIMDIAMNSCKYNRGRGILGSIAIICFRIIFTQTLCLLTQHMLLYFLKSTLSRFRTHQKLWQVHTFFFVAFSHNIQGWNNLTLYDM